MSTFCGPFMTTVSTALAADAAAAAEGADQTAAKVEQLVERLRACGIESEVLPGVANQLGGLHSVLEEVTHCLSRGVLTPQLMTQLTTICGVHSFT